MKRFNIPGVLSVVVVSTALGCGGDPVSEPDVRDAAVVDLGSRDVAFQEFFCIPDSTFDGGVGFDSGCFGFGGPPPDENNNCPIGCRVVS